MPTPDIAVLTADKEGVTLEHEPGKRSSVAWSEICRVSGHKLDLMSRVVTVVNLDTEYGECFELMTGTGLTTLRK